MKKISIKNIFNTQLKKASFTFKSPIVALKVAKKATTRIANGMGMTEANNWTVTV